MCVRYSNVRQNIMLNCLFFVTKIRVTTNVVLLNFVPIWQSYSLCNANNAIFTRRGVTPVAQGTKMIGCWCPVKLRDLRKML